MGKTRKDRRDKDFVKKDEGGFKKRQIKEKTKGWTGHINAPCEEVVSDLLDEEEDDFYDYWSSDKND